VFDGVSNKVYEQKLLKNQFWHRSDVIYEHLQYIFIESQKKMQNNAFGIKSI
jgi:hypothetical protein